MATRARFIPTRHGIGTTRLLDDENVPADRKVHEFFEREVKPHVKDAWVNESVRDEKDKEIGIVG